MGKLVCRGVVFALIVSLALVNGGMRHDASAAGSSSRTGAHSHGLGELADHHVDRNEDSKRFKASVLCEGGSQEASGPDGIEPGCCMVSCSSIAHIFFAAQIATPESAHVIGSWAEVAMMVTNGTADDPPPR